MRLIFSFGLVLGLLVGCSTVSHQAGNNLALAAYRIEQVLNKNAGSSNYPDWKEWQNFLVFSNSNIRVPLARSATAQTDLRYGFDPSSLKLSWLKENELLWISWSTFGQGSGGYYHKGNVILQIHGDQGCELIRDHVFSSRAGWGAENFASLKIACNDNIIRLTRCDIDINGGMGSPDMRYPLPFTTVFTNDDGQVGHISEVDSVNTWDYKLIGRKLWFLHGVRAVDLGDEGQAVDEIVKGFHVSRTDLESMNPGLCGRQTATGIVHLSEKSRSYEISPDDGLDESK